MTLKNRKRGNLSAQVATQPEALLKILYAVTKCYSLFILKLLSVT